MSSSFGWLDTDEQQRRKVLEIVQLFKEQGTVDEMGVGAVRDTFSNALFPGTSVLHTRLRYALFVPWLLQLAASKSTPEAMERELKRLEVGLIDSLGAGGETEGVIGRLARQKLKQVPSNVYWAMLGTWGLRTDAPSIAAFFRHAKAVRALNSRASATDDPGVWESVAHLALDPDLPDAPEGLLDRTTFELRAAEEIYLSTKIIQTAPGSLLAWLVQHEPATSGRFVWDLAEVSDLPAPLAELVDHAHRFSATINGAPLLYNLLLARKRSEAERVEGYELRIAEWKDSIISHDVLDGWVIDEFWDVVHRHHPRIHPLTQFFVRKWVDLVRGDHDIARSAEAARLVAHRERQIKGGRARLVNQSALDRWRGDSGTGRLDFRWGVTRTLLEDLYAARRVNARA